MQHTYNPQSQYGYADGDQTFDEESTRPRLPSIFLAQQQPGFDNQAYMAFPNSPRMNRLSTISERTERTEPSMLYRSYQQSMVPNTPRSFVSSDSTDYGQELGKLHVLRRLKMFDRANIGPNSSQKIIIINSTLIPVERHLPDQQYRDCPPMIHLPLILLQHLLTTRSIPLRAAERHPSVTCLQSRT